MYQEHEVVKDNNFYRYIFENVRDPVLIIRPDGRIIDANRAIIEAVGFTKTELLSMNVSDLRPLSEKPKVCEDLGRSREGCVFETIYQRRDGRVFPVEISTQGATLGGELVFLEIIRDITRRKQADEAVNRLRATLEKSQEIAHLGSWELDLENNLLTWSDEAYRIFGLKPQEFGATYEAFLEVVHPDDRATVDDAYSSSIRLGKKSYEIDHRIVWKRTGEIRFVHEKCEHFRDRWGNITRSVGIVQDITERKMAEDALRASEERFRNFFENAGVGIVIGNTDKKYLAVNDRFCEITGYSREELLKMGCGELVHPDDQEADHFEVQRLLRGEASSFIREFRYVHASGSTVWVRLNISIMRGNRPEDHRLIGVVEEITEQKRAEEARERLLKEVEDQRTRLQAILDSLPVGVWIADATGRMVMTNDITRVIWGGKAPVSERIEDYNQYKFWWSETGERAMAEDMPLARAITHGETRKNILIDIERFDGTRGSELISGAPIRDSGGEIIGGVVIIQDISELRRTEEELKAAKAQAELYLDLMGHDISNMHQIILMQLELALSVMDEEGKLDARHRDMLDIPFKTLERSVNLIHNVRMLQKIRSGEYRAEPLDLSSVIREIVNMYSEVPGRNVTIQYSASPGQTVMASPLIKDVMSNLVDNAVKHAQDPVLIGIGVSQVEHRGIAYYRVSVEDNGSGIPDEKKDLIFQRFKRGQTTAKGTGLGLYIVKTLVESFGGRVEVEDRIAGDHTRGARFSVYLPVAEAG